MKNNNLNNYIQEDEIDLKKIVKLLINSTKLIIVITFVTTILTAIYASQKEPQYISSALIEIGSYDAEINNPKIEPRKIGTKVLVESPNSLIKNLRINFNYKQKMQFNVWPLEGRLIKIVIQSDNLEMNIDSLNKIIGFIKNRHSFLLQKVEYQLTSKIEDLNNNIEYKKEALLTENNDQKLKISNLIQGLKKLIPNIELRIKELTKVILKDESNLKLLQSNEKLLLERAAQYPSLEQVIFNYKSNIIENENERIKLSQEIDNLEVELLRLESNNLESDEIFALSQEKDRLNLALEFLTQQNTTSSQLVGEIVTSPIDSKKLLIILLGATAGFILSIFIVLIRPTLLTEQK